MEAGSLRAHAYGPYRGLKDVKSCFYTTALPIHLLRHRCCRMYRLATMHSVTDRQTDRQTDIKTLRCQYGVHHALLKVIVKVNSGAYMYVSWPVLETRCVNFVVHTDVVITDRSSCCNRRWWWWWWWVDADGYTAELQAPPRCDVGSEPETHSLVAGPETLRWRHFRWPRCRVILKHGVVPAVFTNGAWFLVGENDHKHKGKDDEAHYNHGSNVPVANALVLRCRLCFVMSHVCKIRNTLLLRVLRSGTHIATHLDSGGSIAS